MSKAVKTLRLLLDMGWLIVESMEETVTEILPSNNNDKPQEHYTLADWLSLKRDFIQGKGSLQKLCERHDFSYGTAKNRCATEKWDAKRAAYIKAVEAKMGFGDIAENAASLVAKEPVDSELAITLRQLEMVNNALLMSIASRDIADLSKAKATLVETLHILRHGGKPPTLAKPSSKPSRRASDFIPPTPAD